MSKQSVRLTLDVSNELNDALDRMAKEAHSTKSDILRKSFVLMEVALKEKKKHNRMAIINDKDDVVKEIVGY